MYKYIHTHTHTYIYIFFTIIINLSIIIRYNTFSKLKVKERSPYKESKDLQVIAPTDKATDNVCFICQRFYAQILVKKDGI